MGKARKVLVGLLCIVNAMLGVFSLTACEKENSSSDTCEHDYAWYSVKCHKQRQKKCYRSHNNVRFAFRHFSVLLFF